MELKIIAYARNGHTDKFGIPRQSRDESPIVTRIVFEPEYAVREALRGIEEFSHLWLLWGFTTLPRNYPDNDPLVNDVNAMHWSPTVRPPRLGGNKRMGVFATRSPFRPNPIGLTSVRLLGVENGDLLVSGADLLDGTPIYDIKPYLSFSDSHPEAQNGFAEETKDYRLKVEWLLGPNPITSPEYPSTSPIMSRKIKEDIEYILSQDPRPAYQDDPSREYKMEYAGNRVTFVVHDQTVVVKKVEKI